jgi:uncharacterized membrane protein
MEAFREYLMTRWLAVLLLATGLLLAGLLSRSRRGIFWSGLAMAIAGIGGLAIPEPWGLYLGLASLVLLAIKFAYLLLSTKWFPGLATALIVAVLAGFGSWAARPMSDGVREIGRSLLNLEVVQPWWLVLLATVPMVIALSRRSLAGLGLVRKWIAIALRCLVVTLLTLALAEVRLRKPGDNTTVIFLVDRSFSIPQEPDPKWDEKKGAIRPDLRWNRVKQFVNDAVSQRGPGHERDQAGVIAFGRRPRLVLPPAEVPRLNFEEDIIGPIDEYYTDIGAALKLALASFPEGTGRRVVLLSDGNENLGNAEEQAKVAVANGVQIDVVPLASGYRNENEVLVQRVEAPTVTEQGGRVPIRVLVRSYNPNLITGELALRQTSEGETVPIVIEPGPGVEQIGPPAIVQLRPGLNAFSFRQTLAGVQKSYTYQAVFTPKSVTASGTASVGLPGDRVQNNAATTHVLALGRRRVLFIESAANADKSERDHAHLVDMLQGSGDTKFQISAIVASELPTKKSDLGVFLSNYDCVVLANVPADDLTEDQMEMIRSNTHDQGCGLVMIGGPDSYGAGGYQATAIEKALPVDCDIQAVKVAGKGGLVLLMHASEAADGNALQKQVAKLAISKLSPVDMVGVLYYDGMVRWHIPFREIGSRRNALYQLVDRMVPGDMPDFDPALKMAYSELNNPAHKLTTKHMIVISDGDPMQNDRSILTDMRKAGITCSTVGIATHGNPEVTKMMNMANVTNGRFHNNPAPKSIPAIYIKETRTVSQSYIVENRFNPQLRSMSGPTDRMQMPLPPLYGFVRSSLKQSPLVEMAIEGPSTLEQRYPILAYWQYGLGKAVAYTSDARSRPQRNTWDQAWAGSDMYKKFWEQLIGWSLRGVESGKLGISTEYRDGKVRVVVDARDDRNRPITDLRLKGGVTTPEGTGDGKPLDLKFEQRAGGVYEAEFKAEEMGSYFINAQAIRSTEVVKDGKKQVVEETDSIRTGVTVPYSPEFTDLESNSHLLRKIAQITGGNVYTEGDAELQAVAKAGTVFRPTPAAAKALQPIWFWLVLAAGGTFLLDVAVRRIALEPHEAKAWAERTWSKLRGRVVEKSAEPFLERLRSKKEQVATALEREKSTKRFEAPTEPVAPPPTMYEPPKPKLEEKPQAPAEGKSEADAFARLMEAKRKALGDRGRSDESS